MSSGRDYRSALFSRLAGLCAMRRQARGLTPPAWIPPVPAGAKTGEEAARLALFVKEAEAAGCTVEILAGTGEVPEAVAAIARRHALSGRPVWVPEAELAGLDWQRAQLQAACGPQSPLPCPEDAMVVVTSVICAIAETGSLMLISGPAHPTRAAFLPRVHVAVVPEERIVPGLDDAWVRLRMATPGGTMPRAVNWITGPSRTADIEQTLVEGAHGPAWLHVLVVRAHA